ncbi:hypothetical protein D4764_04G0013730, partial [Takifugu flavidus]
EYYHRFLHFVNMVSLNSWALYRRDSESTNVPQEKQKDSLDIRTAIGQALSMQGKDLSTKKRWWPSSDEEQDFDRKKHSGPAQRSTTMLWLTGQKSTANTVMPLSQGPQSRSAENVVFIFASQERSIP